MRTLIIHNPCSGFSSDAIFEFERALLKSGDECLVKLVESALKFKDCIRAKTRARIVNDEGSHISSEDLRQAGISF